MGHGLNYGLGLNAWVGGEFSGRGQNFRSGKTFRVGDKICGHCQFLLCVGGEDILGEGEVISGQWRNVG